MSNVTAQIDLYDHEILEVERAWQAVQSKQGRMVDLESYRREIVERFAERGFRVDVDVYETNHEGLYHFEVTIRDRQEPIKEFDFDRQVHEVTNDLLDLGEGGVIKTEKKESPGLWTPGTPKGD